MKASARERHAGIQPAGISLGGPHGLEGRVPICRIASSILALLFGFHAGVVAAERVVRTDLVDAWIASAKLKPASTEKLVARFRFDEGNGAVVKNSAPGAQPAILTAEKLPPVWGELVKHWPAMRLAATTELRLGQLGDFDFTDAFTVAGWFKPRVGRGTKKGALVSKMALGEKNRGWELHWDDGTTAETPKAQRWPEGRLAVNLIHESGSAIMVRAPRTISRLEWAHLAFTCDGSGKAAGVRLFINGEPQPVEVLRDKLAGSIRTSAPLQLGRRTDGAGAFVEKAPLIETSFQDLRIYARRLDDDEVRRTMDEDFIHELLSRPRWLVSAENPLVARVTVNRMWQELFGTGLVATPGDFGIVGARPSHFALLDWLAVDFREHGWDVKRFYKQVVMSATYRQSARTTPALLERDPANRLLARGPRFRLDGEMIRDSALAATGLLVEKPGGPGVNIYQPPGLWEAMAMDESNTRTHRRDSGDALHRRSLYTFWKRTSAPPVFTTFDAPLREVCVVQRERTDTPLQALVALNAPDRAVLRATFEKSRADFYEAEAREFLNVGDSPVNASLPARELAAWSVVASQLLNTDQALNK